jgi:simple sugar transport system ATP-binding protein
MHERLMSFVPADRQRFGLVLSYSLSECLILTDYYAEPYSRGILRNEDAIDARVIDAIERFDVRTPGPDVKAGTLSGGNQQKLIVAREFGRDLKLLVLDQPTRGLDVGSIEFIHKEIIKKRDAGTAVLLVSAELDEILELSDRIAVIYRGRIVEIVDGRAANKEAIGLLMATGGRSEAALRAGAGA